MGHVFADEVLLGAVPMEGWQKSSKGAKDTGDVKTRYTIHRIYLLAEKIYVFIFILSFFLICYHLFFHRTHVKLEVICS